MAISSYLCNVIGQRPEELRHLSKSSIDRAKAYAIAIHLPVLLWAFSGYFIAANLFGCGVAVAAMVGLACAAMVYLVERIVLGTPNNGWTLTFRCCIAVVTAVLGTLMFDLVIFDREITEQLSRDGESRIEQEFNQRIGGDKQVAAARDREWLQAQQRAECEANGRCGSGQRKPGPVYRELKRHADQLHRDYLESVGRVANIEKEKAQKIAEWRTNGRPTETAGLLARSVALETVLEQNPAARIWWLVMFCLVLGLELMVVAVKFSFKATVDDERVEAIEGCEIHRVRQIRAAASAPDGEARSMLWSLYGTSVVGQHIEQHNPQPSQANLRRVVERSRAA